MYFLRGKLPWSGIAGRSKLAKYENVKNKKMEVTAEELCKGYPREF